MPPSQHFPDPGKTLSSANQPRRLTQYLLLALAVAFCAVVIWWLLIQGLIAWGFSQPAVTQGGPEALFLLLALACLSRIDDVRWRVGTCLLLAALFLRRHAVDLPLAIDLLYLEVIVALGAGLARVLGSKSLPETTTYLRWFVLGLGAWSTLAWSLSALGFGTPRDMRWLTLLLCVPLIIGRARPLSIHVVKKMNGWSKSERMLGGAIAGLLLVQFARTNVVFGFDSLWYGLRSEMVFVGEGSAFATQALVSPVHYFPKMYEMLLLPFSGLGDSSVIVGVTIMVLGLTALAISQLLKLLGVADRMLRLCGVAVCITLPALSNAALEPKPDVIACFLILLTWLFADCWLRGERLALFWMFACGILATQAKLTAIPFLGMLGLGIIASAMIAKRSTPIEADRHGVSERRVAFAALVLAMAVAVFVSARTFMLTGMPTIGPDPLFHLWQRLGFELVSPAGTLTWTHPQDWTDVPSLGIDWLFRPDHLEHVAISWTGNVWLWLPIASLALAWRSPARPDARRSAPILWTGVSLVLCGAILALGWSYHVRGSDGNYFISAIIPGTLLGIGALHRRLGQAVDFRRTAIGCLLLFAMCQAAIGFMTAAWSPGTLAFDVDLTRNVRDTRPANQLLLKTAGLASIANFLHAQPAVSRVIGCAKFEDGVRIPARFEDLATISYSHPEFTKDGLSVVAFMRQFHIPYLLLQKTTPATDPQARGTPNDLCTPGHWIPPGATVAMDDESYVLYRIDQR
ncbi:MAG: hypothetical protein ABI411_00515 [Tahibacter sp.]